jgi:tetratricopeptide (TPR) repeat protein
MPDPTDHAVELFNQAQEVRAQGDLERAESLCAQAIEIFQNVEGENSPDAANLLNALTHWREERGDYEGAIEAAQRAVNILDALGADFSSEDAACVRIEAQSNLGNLLRHLARYPDAEAILKRTLTFASVRFGEASDEASNARNNLGILYKYTGKFDDAKILYETALENIEREYGREHISTASLYHNLGGLEHARGDFVAGEEPARKAWDIRRKHLGENHPDALADAVAYAGVLDGLERYDESEKIYRDVLVEYEKIYPAEHYEIAAVLHNLGNVRFARGDYAEAETLMRRTLAIKQKLLGDEHPDTALSMNNLGVLLQAQGKNDDARELFQRALEIFQATLGDEHPQTQMARENLQSLVSNL